MVNPPTFKHFPVARAQKLKKIWVQTKKVKAKWRTVKAKQAGEVGPKHDLFVPPQEEARVIEIETEPRGSYYPTTNKQKTVVADKRSKEHHWTASSHSSRPAIDDVVSPTSQHLASNSSSRTENSRPLHHESSKRNGKLHPTTETSRNARRRQPNMKLRMEVLLEKIKRDHAESIGR